MSIRTRLSNVENETIPLRWGWWHISCFLTAMEEETGEECRAFPDDPYTFTSHHEFTDESDGEVLVIEPGYKYEAWR